MTLARERAVQFVPGLRALAGRLDEPAASEAQVEWLAGLQTITGDDVLALGPVTVELARSSQEMTLFDTYKRPDFRALPEMRTIVGESLRRLWNVKDTGFWPTVREAEKRKLNVREAPTSDFEHYLRTSGVGEGSAVPTQSKGAAGR
jgi:hypothetical protein